jgi:hypothetical protein
MQADAMRYARSGTKASSCDRAPHDTGWEWIVDFHGVSNRSYCHSGRPSRALRRSAEHFADSCQLAPLTDPAADAFLERHQAHGRASLAS